MAGFEGESRKMKVNTRGYPNPDHSQFHIPPGEYLCIITSIDTGLNTENPVEERWLVKGEIKEGDHTGKKWQDRWIFNSNNPNIQRRQVLIQHRIGGFPKEYEGEIEPEDFVGREIYVTFKDNFHNGKTYHNVTFNGYRAVEQATDIKIAEEEKRIADALDSAQNDVPVDEIPF